MTKEQNVRSILESNFAGFKDEIIDIAVKNIMALSENNGDTISRGTLEQIMWERDIAIQQLKDLGYSLGEKPKENKGDLISKQTVLDMLEDINAETEGVGFYYKHYVEFIKKLPSVENKGEGKWIAQDIHNCHTNFKCSKCGYVHDFMHLYGEPTADYTYCPNCGADMRGNE